METSLIVSIAALTVSCVIALIQVLQYRAGRVKVQVKADIEPHGRYELGDRERL